MKQSIPVLFDNASKRNLPNKYLPYLLNFKFDFNCLKRSPTIVPEKTKQIECLIRNKNTLITRKKKISRQLINNIEFFVKGSNLIFRHKKSRVNLIYDSYSNNDKNTY